MNYCQIIFLYFLGTNLSVAQNESVETEIVCFVPHLNSEPEFPGGIDKLNLFFKSELKGNRKVRNKKIPIEFTILRNGNVDNMVVLDKAIKISQKQINRILREMPKWKPAIFESQVVEKKIVLMISL